MFALAKPVETVDDFQARIGSRGERGPVDAWAGQGGAFAQASTEVGLFQPRTLIQST